MITIRHHKPDTKFWLYSVYSVRIICYQEPQFDKIIEFYLGYIPENTLYWNVDAYVKIIQLC